MTRSALVSDTAMVMAAGLGKRMLPLTATRPKPLVEVAGRTLIDLMLDHLEDAGIAKAVVNVHYLPDQIEAHLVRRKRPETVISDERAELLETGGGMIKAWQAGLLPDPFYCVNSDNVWIDGPRNTLLDLSAAWDPARMDALLLVVPRERAFQHHGKGDFHLGRDGRLRRRGPDEASAPTIYIGAQIVAHRLLRDPPEGPFSTMVLWERAIAEGRLFGVEHRGEWFDMGTPDAIPPAEARLRGG
ncbi:MAG: nucleotidyltransferase family protein [Novosphingobium sp.]|uniref:nucleotidyltransferase family protein n=1 Tax=Novosphingobium sp. TaxID=1874826 RepID=UPI0017EF4AF6|nr:nucleotidyltransferase family protein [Novosphingobium sp.]